MGKNKNKAKGGQGQEKKQPNRAPDGGNLHEEEPVVRLVALHGNLVVVAVGNVFRVLDWR
jgi:hypothetical protein